MAHIEGKGRTGEVDRRAKMQGVTVLVGTIGASIGCSFHKMQKCKNAKCKNARSDSFSWHDENAKMQKCKE